MSDKQPIPIPAEQKWQDFRQIVLPVVGSQAVVPEM